MYRNRLKKHRFKLSFQRAMQLSAAVLFNGYLVGFQKGKIFSGAGKAFCIPVLNCYSCPGALGACPIGSLQSALGGMKRQFPFYVLGTLMLFGILLGRAVCGLLCPFGLVQDLLHKIPLPKLRVPQKLDKAARSLKYILLLIIIVGIPLLAAVGGQGVPPLFCKYICPAGTLEGGIPLLAANPQLRQLAGFLFSWKMLVLLAVLAASAMIHRPFCKYLCPLGAFYSLFHRISFYQLRLDPAKCTGCSKCAHSCPMGVELPKAAASPECIRCGKCRDACPQDAISLGFEWTGKTQEKEEKP